MTIEYSILEDLELVITQTYGAVTDEQVVEHFRILSQDPKFKPNFLLLSDIRYITQNTITEENLKSEAKLSPYDRKTMRVILVKRSQERKKANQYGVHSTQSNAYYRVTDDIDDALSWLGIDQQAGLILPLLHKKGK